jgi:CheY-like chemotaxis protein
MSHVIDNVPRPLRVLVVDDDHDGADSLCELLGCYGHLCRAAYDAESALIEAESFRPEVAVLDLGMRVSGYDLAKQLLARERPPFLVAMTGYSDEAHYRRAAEGGFGHYLVKPAQPHDVLGVLAGVAAS